MSRVSLCILFIYLQLVAIAQDPIDSVLVSLDTVPQIIDSLPDFNDSLTINDTMRVYLDSLLALADSSVTPPLPYEISLDAVKDPVDYDSRDSSWMDNVNKVVHLYGKAYVKYTNLEVRAPYIQFNVENNIAVAFSMPDSTGEGIEKAAFTDGKFAFEAEKMSYNFKTKKGVVHSVTSKEKDIVIHNTKTKFFGINAEGYDNEEEFIFSSGALFTTCDHPDPHFGIRSSKQKLIPDKVAVAGPSYLEIMGVPTPLVLPFGLFPLNPEQKTGLLFPSDFESSEKLGFGLKDIGYYFHINNRMDLSVMGELYTRGTWGISVRSNYKKKYKFSGNLYTSFRNEKQENLTTAQIESAKRFAIKWSHRQDQNSNPYHNFSASVNMDFNKHESQVNNDAENVLKSTYSSNLSYNRKFPGKPYSFSASASHSQNTQSRKVNVTLPDMRFNLRRINPLDLKRTKGDSEMWFEKIGFQYDASFRNSLTATDTTLFEKETLDKASFGLKHNASLTSPFSVMKYINVNPSLRYEESWYFKTEEKEFDPTMIIDTVMAGDTISRVDTTFGTVNTIYNYGLKPVRKMSASISLGTSLEKIFQLPFKKIPAFRHKMTPSVSYSYSPNWVPEGTNQKLYMTDLRPEENDTLDYSIYASNFLLRPNPNVNTSQVVSFSLGNNFEAKYMTRKDSTLKKMSLLSSLSISSSYNVVTDSFSSVRFAPSSIKLFKGLTNIAMNMTMSPYAKNADGKVIKEFYWEDAKRLLRFEQASMTVTTGISVQKIRNIFSNEEKSTPKPPVNSDAHILDLFNKLNLTHILRVERDKRANNDTLILRTNNIRLQGSIPLSKAWTLGIGSIGYEFTKKAITYPSFSLKRDLHCWQLSFSWAPQRNSYAFNIAVKPGTLQFIKLPYKRNNIDGNLTL